MSGLKLDNLFPSTDKEEKTYFADDVHRTVPGLGPSCLGIVHKATFDDGCMCVTFSLKEDMCYKLIDEGEQF